MSNRRLNNKALFADLWKNNIISQSEGLKFNSILQVISSIVLLTLFFISVSEIKAQDTIPPVIITPAMDQQAVCGAQGLTTLFTNWYQNAGGAVAEDDSGTFQFIGIPPFGQALIQFVPIDSLCGLNRSVTVTFIAVDEAGNSSQPTTATFSTFDNVRPVISKGVSNRIYNCVPGIRDTLRNWIQNHGFAEATDNCSDNLTWTNFIWNSNTGQQGMGSIANGPYPNIPQGVCNWNMNISFFVVDECGNTQATTGSFGINDTYPPEFSEDLDDITISCDEIPNPGSVTAFDDCSGNVDVVFSQASTQNSDPQSCDHYNYTIVRQWIATDNCGNVAEKTQTITVRNAEDLQITAPTSVNISCEQVVITDPFEFGILAENNCSPLQIEMIETPFTVSCLFEFNRNYKFTDVCQQSAEVNVQFIARDSTPPSIISSPQNQSFSCDEITDFEGEFAVWLASRAGSSATDICNTVSFFAARPGSYNLSNPATFPGAFPTGLPPSICPSSNPGFLRSALIDFVYYDACGNAVVESAIFGVADDQAPVLDDCPANVQVILDDDQCSVNTNIDIPNVTDNCSESVSPIIRVSSVQVRSQMPGNQELPVDEVNVRLGPFRTGSFQTTGNLSLTIELINIDGDNPSEFFRIFDETGNFIANTPNTPTQCGSVSMVIDNINNATLNAWLQDGFIDLRFVPNIPEGLPILAINDICVGSRIRVTSSFEINPSSITTGTFKIGQETIAQVFSGQSIPLTLTSGNYDAEISFSDCAQNEVTCNFNIQVIDRTPPIMECPSDMFLVTDADSCNTAINLSVDIDISDNCGFDPVYSQTAPPILENQLISFTFNNQLGNFVATNKSITFGNLPPRPLTDQSAILEVTIQGNITGNGKQFTLFGENGELIGSTAVILSEASCSTSTVRFEISPSLYNLWALDGSITFNALAAVGSFIEGGGINPCTPLESGENSDGVSRLSARLFVFDARISYEFSGATTRAKQQLVNNLEPISARLNAGITNLIYYTTDSFGNEGSCTTQITVEDRQAPAARCKNATIQTHPSGIQETQIESALIDDGSSDNCGITAVTINPTAFDCNAAGTSRLVLMTVSDAFGNTSTCESLVKVDPFQLTPTYEAGLCLGDTLKFFANIPASESPVNYSISWFRDGNLFSNEENPFLPNIDESFNGTYRLEIRGFNNCVSEGVVNVNIQPLTTPELNTDKTTICEGTMTFLTSNSFQGNVNYKWYTGQFPNGLLLGVTQSPVFAVSPPLGSHFYYMIAENDECNSAPSAPRRIDVVAPPVATVRQNFISICEGESLLIGTDVVGPNISYNWTGPNGFQSNQQNPPAIRDITLLNQGRYTLIISNEICASDTVGVQVAIFLKPPIPIISGDNLLCEGQDLNLSVENTPNIIRYRWLLNGQSYQIGPNHFIEIAAASPNLSGRWQVISEDNNCLSDTSAAFIVMIESQLEVGASNTGPACEGDSITIFTTFIPNSTYQWTGPSGFVATGQSIRTIAVPGEYFVNIETSSGCQASASTTVTVVSPASITALSNNSEECMAKGSSIQFFPTIFPPGQYTYQWSGPNNFTSNQLNPVIMDVSEINNGNYTLTVLTGSCPSAPATTQVNLRIIPDKPTVTGEVQYCVGENITLISSYSGNNNWNTPTGQINTGGNSLEIVNAGINLSGIYSVIARNGNCPSEPSDPISISVVAAPSRPVIEGVDTYCHGELISLSAVHSQGQFMWTGPDGTIYTGNPLLITANEITAGLYRVVSSIGRCASAPSEPFRVNVREQIRTPQPAQNYFRICASNQNTLQICLDPGTIIPGGFYELYHMQTGNIIGTTTTTCFNIIPTQLLPEGLNFLFIRTLSNGCRSSSSTQIAIEINRPPDIRAMASFDQFVLCEDDFVDLISLTSSNEVDVRWTALSPGIFIARPEEGETVASGFRAGVNLIELSYSKDGCNNFSRDTVRIILEEGPVASPDNYSIPYGQNQFLPVFTNDRLPANFNFTVIRQPEFGRIEFSNGMVRYVADNRFVGQVSFEYEICSDDCPDLCAKALVSIDVGSDTECFAPSIITPNGDGINDYFVVPCLNLIGFQNNRLSVFNQWGNQVYSSAPYNNNWDGTYAGDPLPVGTYYYVLEFPNSNRNSIYGFLIIQR